MFRTESIIKRPDPQAMSLIIAFVAVDLLIIYNIIHMNTVGIAALWSVGWLAVILIVTAVFAEKEDKGFLFVAATLTFTANILVAAYFASFGDVYFSDEEMYIQCGKELAQKWQEGNFLGFFEYQYELNRRNFGYYLVNGIHFLVWPHKILPLITNVGLKTLTGFYVYLTARRLFNRKYALVACSFILFNPFNAYWASFNLKDTSLGFLVAVAMYLLATTSGGSLLRRGAYLIITLILMTSIRFYTVFLLGIAFGGYLFLSREMSNVKKAGIAVLLLLSLFVLRSNFLIFNDMSEAGSVEYVSNAVQRANENLEKSRFSLSGHVTGVNPKSLVMSFAHFILTPSPFNSNPRVRYMIPGTLFWYFLFPYYVIGTLVLIRKSWKDNFFLYAYPWSIMIFYTFVPWLGSSRHRLMMMPFVAILAVVGFYAEMKHKKLLLGLGYVGIAAGVLVAEAVILA